MGSSQHRCSSAASSVEFNSELRPNPVPSRSERTWTKILAAFGLPCLISVAAIDPGNLEVDLQAGSLLGYKLLWVLILSSAIGWVLQTLAAHITIDSGLHLAQLYARAYSHDKFLSYSIFTVSELSVISFDIAEVVGTAFALQLLFGWPLWLGMLLSAFDTLLVLYFQRTGMTKIEIIIEALLFVLSVCLFYEFILAKPDFVEILEGAVTPSLGKYPRQGALLSVGLLGSVVMSHNLFLHSWLIKDRIRKTTNTTMSVFGEETTSDQEGSRRYATIEAGAIFFATFIVNACVLSVTSALPRDRLPDDIGLKDAGALLQRLLGSELASKAWAIALLCSGHAATVTGTLASQSVCEGFLNIESRNASSMVILGTRAVAIFPALFAALIAGEKGSDTLIVYSQVVLSLALPFGVIPMFKLFAHIGASMRISSSTRAMIVAGYAAFGLLILANSYVLLDIVGQILSEGGALTWKMVLVFAFAASAFIWKLLVTPIRLAPFAAVENGYVARDERQPLLADAKPP